MPVLTSKLSLYGQNVPLIHTPPNWEGGAEHSLIFDTATNRSGLRHEQRGTRLGEDEEKHSLSLQYLCHAQYLSVGLYNLIAGTRGKSVVLPFWAEVFRDFVDREGTSSFGSSDVDLADLSFRTLEIIRFDMDDPDKVENQKVDSIDLGTNTGTVEYDWQLEIPPERQAFCFCRGAILQSVKRDFKNDSVWVIDSVWSSYDDGLLP